MEEVIENSVSGESRRGGEDKVLDDLEKVVLKIYEKCVGENEACISTIDMLHHIEVRMETLTQEQEVLHPQKVWLAKKLQKIHRKHTSGGAGEGDLREGAAPQGEGGSAGEAEADGGGAEQGGS